jgi:hypothetical protein
MSSLTNLQINQSYKGLLKLENSTSGLTSSLQSVQDGEGNDTGIKIATNRLEGGNLFNLYTPSVAKYYGNGFGTTGAAPNSAGGVLSMNTFYDNGIHSYSAFTINVTTLGSGESIDVSFYNAQYLEGYGYVPYQQLNTAVNIDTSSTGLKTGTFASPISFSGTGAGVYFLVCKWNGSSTPITRVGNPSSAMATFIQGLMLGTNGVEFNTLGTLALSPFESFGTVTNIQTNQYNTSTFPATWTSTELNLLSNTAGNNYNPGFLLHTVR